MFKFNLHPRPLKSGFTQDWNSFPSGRDHSAKGADHAQINSSSIIHSGKLKELAENLFSSSLFNTNIRFCNSNICNITFVTSHNKFSQATFLPLLEKQQQQKCAS